MHIRVYVCMCGHMYVCMCMYLGACVYSCVCKLMFLIFVFAEHVCLGFVLSVLPACLLKCPAPSPSGWVALSLFNR